MTNLALRLPSLALLTVLAGQITDAAEHVVFISPAGDDRAVGTAAAPYATLPRAMTAVRELKISIRQGATEPGGIKVVLRAGTYALSKPLVFGPADSGTARCPVTYMAAPGEKVVISGGKRLDGPWKRSLGKPYWQLDVPEARAGKWNFHSLTVNGESRQRARTPNWGQRVFRAQGREPGGDPRQALVYFPGDFDPSWTNPEDIDVVLLCSWTPTIHRLREVVPERSVLRFHSSHFRTVDFAEKNFRYYLSNVFEALDEPGEWYLNRRTGTLFYYPLPEEDINRAEVIAPQILSELVVFQGDLPGARFVEHLHFQDLAFRHVDGDMDKHDGVYRQGHMFLSAAILAKGLRQASFERCEFSQLGEYALELADGCRDVTVRQCHFWDSGAGAIQLGVSKFEQLLEPRRPGADSSGNVQDHRMVMNLVVNNNCIHRLGTIWHGCYAVVNRFASFTRITHNDIFDVHFTAIALDARWDWRGEKYSHGNVVAYNHLHDLGLRYSSDAGAIYQFGPLDTRIHHNVIHDAVAYPHWNGYTGVYLDQQSRHALVENNLVYNVEWYAFHQHKGTDNLFRNNIGAFCRDGFLNRGELNDLWRANYLRAERNIYISNSAIAIRKGWVPGDRPPVLTRNLYQQTLADSPLLFDGKPFADWQAKGIDAESVLGDSGCRNPTALDFSLGDGAAARAAIGFEPFDEEIKKAGLYGDPEWRATPARQWRRQPTQFMPRPYKLPSVATGTAMP